jgi:ribosomal protein L7/L12
MDIIGEKDCNAKELARLLVGSIQTLLTLNQWNSFTKLQAVDDPFRFIEEVAKHADALEREDESKGLFHLRITDVTPEGSTNKINCIKILRQMFGWGLADSKVSFEALPGSGHEYSKTSPSYSIVSREFSTQESLMESKEWGELQTGKRFFMFDMVRLPNGTPASKPFEAPRY